ncbi:hypothetical protein diail_7193 [Diaporthe ilicicola]|nr:hypothetical protein diail_7193 [Diaporthe ilicicola]
MDAPSVPKSDHKPKTWLNLDHWRLETPRASFATRDGWSNEDVDVVPPEKRTWREIDYLWLWLADGANVGTMQQAGSILALGLSWREASAAMLVERVYGVIQHTKLIFMMNSAIGNILIAAAVALNGTIGSKHHVPFSIASRASMGFYFSYFAVVSRLVLGLIYFGYVHISCSINTYIGASCMLIMLESIWPGIRVLPNNLEASSSIASNKMIAYFVFWICEYL